MLMSPPTTTTPPATPKHTLVPPTYRRFHFHLPPSVPALDAELVHPTTGFQRDHPVLRSIYQRHHAQVERLHVDIEYSLHACPMRMFQEFKLIFPELFGGRQEKDDAVEAESEVDGTEGGWHASTESLSSMDSRRSFGKGIAESLRLGERVKRSQVLVMPTFQPCQYDLVGMGPEQDREKDDKLEMFYLWAITLCSGIRNQGHWADLTDPASGYPVLGRRGPSYYPDVPGAQLLLKYDVMSTGCCSVLLHPKWASKVYPATVFTTAPAQVVLDVLRDEMHSEEVTESV